MGCLFSCHHRKKTDDFKKTHRTPGIKKSKKVENEIEECKKRVEDSINLNMLYKKALYTDCQKTADIIMRSALHLDYMNDAVEKKYICDVLIATYIITNEYNITELKKTESLLDCKETHPLSV